MNDFKDEELKIINGQELGTVLIIISLAISFVIIYNQKLILKGEKPILSNEEVSNLVFWNRIFLTLIIAYFLYLSYKNVVITDKNNGDKYIANLQLLTAFMAFIVGLVGLYTVIYSRRDTSNATGIDELLNDEI